MKKIFNYFTIIVCVLVFANMKSVFAAEIKSSDIPNSTYVIGKSMFTRDVSDSYSGSLSTDVIMLAAKTIDSNKLEDMIIYYKNARETWVNALTNNEIEVPERFDIQYKNNLLYVEKPTLSIKSPGSNTLGTYSGIFTVTHEGVYAGENAISSISGFELYKKAEEGYTFIDEITSEDSEDLNIVYGAKVGETETIVGRVYALDAKGNKVYSDYSNEIELKSMLEKPMLAVGAGAGNSLGVYGGIFTVTSNGAYTDVIEAKRISGWELYEKNNDKYTLLDSVAKEDDEYLSLECWLEIGETKTVVARVYGLDSKGNKVYSDYSNEIELKNLLETPTVAMGSGSGNSLGVYGGGFNVMIEGDYASFDEIERLSGFELYEKNNDKYTLLEIVTKEESEYLNLEYWLEIGQTKTVVGRVYALDSKGNKVYSDYSNEIELKNLLETPTLSIPNGYGETDGNAINAKLNFVVEGAYADEDAILRISGWELYEKVGTQYNLVKSIEEVDNIEVTVDVGETKTYVAKVYAKDSKGNKVYSQYSNELTIENKN